MLVIRDEQFQRFRHAALEALDARLRRAMRAEPVAAQLSDQQLTCLTARAIGESRRFRLLQETELLRFAKILCAFCGSRTDRELPVPALQILLSYGGDPALKLDRFENWVATSSMISCELNL